MYGKPLVFAVILVIVVTLIYGSSYRFTLLAVPPGQGFADAEDCVYQPFPLGFENLGGGPTSCCWEYYEADEETDAPISGTRCQVCVPTTEGEFSCGPETEMQTLDEGVLPPPPLRTLPDGGDIPTLEPVEPPLPPQLGEANPDLTPPGALEAEPPALPAAPQIGEIAPQPTADEERDQIPPEPLPPCPEGEELNEESDVCVPVESSVAEQPQDAKQPEEPSEEPSSEDDSSN